MCVVAFRNPRLALLMSLFLHFLVFSCLCSSQAAACAFVAPQNKVSNTAIGLFGFKKGAKKSKQASKGKGKAVSNYPNA